MRGVHDEEGRSDFSSCTTVATVANKVQEAFVVVAKVHDGTCVQKMTKCDDRVAAVVCNVCV